MPGPSTPSTAPKHGWLRAGGGLFGWLLLRAGAQAVLVLALARWLGADGYGRYVAALAIAGFFTPLAGLGLQGVLLRDGAADPARLPALLRAMLRLWLVSALICGLLALLTAVWWLPAGIPWPALAALVIAEVASSSVVELRARAEQARHRTGVYGAMLAGLILARLAGLGVLALLLPTADVAVWMWVYAGASLAYAALLLLIRQPATHTEAPAPGELLRQGAPFALGALSMRLQAEFNKPLLAQTAYALAGNFGAAQRAVDVAALPLVALQETLWPRIFAADRRDARRRMLRGGLFLLALALAGGGLLFLLAPLLPWLLGAGFGASAQLLRDLAWLPALQVLRNFANIRLVIARQPRRLTGAYLVGAGANVALTAVLIPIYGLVGAVWAAYLGETALALALLAARR